MKRMIALNQRLGGRAGLDQEEINSKELANLSCVCGTKGGQDQ